MAAIAPDVDGLSLLFGVDAYHQWHHTLGHNMFFGMFLAAAIAAITRSFSASALGLVAFHSHLLTDLLGSGADWEIIYFWPLSPFAIKFYPPLQWELVSWQNSFTTALCLLGVGILAIKRRRTIIETISPSADAQIVRAISKRLKSG